MQTGTPLPFYPGDGVTLGAVLTMSRYPCSSDDDVLSGQCCRKQKCANYSGAHAVSRGCVLYGTLEAELAVHIPGGAASACVDTRGRGVRALWTRCNVLTHSHVCSAAEQPGQPGDVRLGHLRERRATGPQLARGWRSEKKRSWKHTPSA